ncbi:hypothetical protein [Soonwooa sp.]|uniref:hypothetical protein n=1 Tax=Soonwooa sp. TaxID=1938592 RepID=UPI00260ABBBA|nr:hypothetical protein [Soonwooa sp.]
MKNLFFIISVLICGFGKTQVRKVDSTTTSNYHFERYLANKKTAKILLIGGAAASALGGVFLLTDDGSGSANSLFTTGESFGYSFLIWGGMSMIGSVPFYIIANHHKGKSIQLKPSFTYQQVNIFAPKTSNFGVEIQF